MNKLESLDLQETDRALATRFARLGDQEAFGAIVDRHGAMVYGTCRRILGDDVEAADAAQETFLQFSKSAGRINGSLGSWLHRVATRRAVDLIRQRASRRRREETYALDAQSGAPHAWPSLEAAVDEALEELPQGLRELVAMHFLEGHNTTEIAAAKAMSQPTVSRRLAEGLDELRRKLRARGKVTDAAALQGLLLLSRPAISDAVRASLAKIALTKAASTSVPVAAAGAKLALAGLAVVLAASTLWFASNHKAKRQVLGRSPVSIAPVASQFAMAAAAEAKTHLTGPKEVTAATPADSPPPRVQDDNAGPGVADESPRQGPQTNCLSSTDPGLGLTSPTPAGGGLLQLGTQTGVPAGGFGGSFALGGASRSGARFTANGPGPHAGGSIMVGGQGSSRTNSQARMSAGSHSNIARAIQSLAYDGSTITWRLGRANPEESRVTFDFSTNGTDWVGLGEGTFKDGVWQLAGVTLPPQARIRARGYATTGNQHNGSTWSAESQIAGRKPRAQ
jgi:RNA polymerase sigma factor (sigma-70 family)